MRCRKSANMPASLGLAMPGVCCRVAVCFLLCALAATTPASGQQVGSGPPSSAGRPGIFELPSAIPGTSEYQLERRSRQLSAMLGELAPVVSALVMLTAAADDPESVSALLQLGLTPDGTASPELCRTIVSLVKHIEPRVQAEAILITDRQGRILYDRGQPAIRGEPDWEDANGTAGQTRGVLVPLIVMGLLLGLAAVVAWWWFGMRAASGESAPVASEARWGFLCTAAPSRLAAVLSEQRPEVVGAIVAELDEHTRARLRPALKRLGHPQIAAPRRPMDPEVSRAVADGLKQMLSAGHDTEAREG